MEPNEQIQPEEEIKDIVLAKQDESIVKIFQQEDIAHLSDIMKEVSSFKRKYHPKKMIVTDIESKEQKENLRLAIQVVRTKRTSLEKEKKEKTKPYRDTVEYINNAYDKAIDALRAVQEPLNKIKEDYEAIIKAKEEEEEIKKKERVNGRIKDVINAGTIFDGSYWAIGSEEFGVEPISLGMVEIETIPDDDWIKIIESIKEKAAFIKNAEEEKKIKEQEAADKLKKDQENLENEKAALAEAAKKIKERIVNTRSRELKSLGFKINVKGDAYVNLSRNISIKEIEEMEDDAWDQKIKQEEKLVEDDLLREKRHQELMSMGLSTVTAYEKYSYKGYYFSIADLATNEAGWESFQTLILNEKKRIDAEEKVQKERYEKIRPYAAFFDHHFLMEKLYLQTEEEFEALFNEKKAAYDKKIADDAKELADKKAKQQAEELKAQGEEAVFEDWKKRIAAVEQPTFESAKFQEKAKVILNALSVIFKA